MKRLFQVEALRGGLAEVETKIGNQAIGKSVLNRFEQIPSERDELKQALREKLDRSVSQPIRRRRPLLAATAAALALGAGVAVGAVVALKDSTPEPPQEIGMVDSGEGQEFGAPNR